MTSRRSFLSSAGAAAAAVADGGAAATVIEALRARRRRWQPFDWKTVRPLAADARLLGPSEELGVWKARAEAIPRDLWRPAARTPVQLETVRPGGNGGRAGYTLLDLAGSYLATRDTFYAEQAFALMHRACEYRHWGGVNDKAKDTDLHAAALLIGLGVTYDLFRDDLPGRQFVIDKLALQGQRMYSHHIQRETLPWEQNHTYIDLGGLWCTAVAMRAEIPDARKWQELGSRALRNAVRLLDGGDGAFYEGVAYWNFGFAHHLLPLLELFRNATGEDPFAAMQSLRSHKRYLMHTLLPGGRYWLNLGDVGATHVARAGLDRARYAMLKFASEYSDPECQFLAGYFARARKLAPADDAWTLLFWDPGVGARDPRQSWTPAHHFADLGLIAARSSWRDDATHLAMRCGPAIGHRATRALLAREVAQWKPGTGHVHPDLNGLLVFDHGEHFLVDTGYTWAKRTNEHSTVAIDGGGQKGEGERWPNYAPWDRFGRIGAFLELPGHYCYFRGEAAQGYKPELQLTRFDRHCSAMMGAESTYLVVHDMLDSLLEHKYEWLLIAIARAERAGPSAYRVVSGQRAMTVHLIEPASPVFAQGIVKVHERPMEGSTPERGHRLSFALSNTRSAQFLAVLAFHSASESGPRVNARPRGAEIVSEGWVDTFAIGGKAGHHSLVRRDRTEINRWAIHGAQGLTSNGRDLFRASAPVSIAAGPGGAVVETRQPVELRIAAPRKLSVRLQPGVHPLRYG